MDRGRADRRTTTLRTRPLRLLARAIERVPSGPELFRQKREGREWDANTGLFLRKPGEGTVTLADILKVVVAAEVA